MGFLSEFVACCGSCSSAKRPPQEEATLLVFPEAHRRRTPRRHGRVRGGLRRWKPSLSSISEDVIAAEKTHKAERPTAAAWRRKLKRKVSSFGQRHRSRSFEGGRRNPSIIVPAFSPMPYMF